MREKRRGGASKGKTRVQGSYGPQRRFRLLDAAIKEVRFFEAPCREGEGQVFPAESRLDKRLTPETIAFAEQKQLPREFLLEEAPGTGGEA